MWFWFREIHVETFESLSNSHVVELATQKLTNVGNVKILHCLLQSWPQFGQHLPPKKDVIFYMVLR